MGWLWASPSSNKPSASAQNQSTPSPSSTTTATPPSSSAPSESVDPEIEKFFDLFSKDAQQASKPSQTAATASGSSSSDNSSSSSWFPSLRTSSKETPTVPRAPLGSELSEALLPTEMSCRQAFDLAWQCNSLGGQWNAVYRDGTMRSCTELWDDFWFCMRTKSYSGEMKARLIKEHYRNKEYAKYGAGRPSSEDVWQSRSEKVAPETAFVHPIDAPTMTDDEWRHLENERRRQIRDGLGYNKPSS